MKATIKATKTFSLDQDILREVKRTKGVQSESERVNRLLRSALDLEKRAELEQEAADFYANAPDVSDSRRAFQSAALRSWARD
jgi:Arc/MetJ family transcription regulator